MNGTLQLRALKGSPLSIVMALILQPPSTAMGAQDLATVTGYSRAAISTGLQTLHALGLAQQHGRYNAWLLTTQARQLMLPADSLALDSPPNSLRSAPDGTAQPAEYAGHHSNDPTTQEPKTAGERCAAPPPPPPARDAQRAALGGRPPTPGEDPAGEYPGAEDQAVNIDVKTFDVNCYLSVCSTHDPIQEIAQTDRHSNQVTRKPRRQQKTRDVKNLDLPPNCGVTVPVRRPLPERWRPLASALVESCGSSPQQAHATIRAVISRGRDPTETHIALLRWLDYCASPKAHSITSPGAFIASRLMQGIPCPAGHKLSNAAAWKVQALELNPREDD